MDFEISDAMKHKIKVRAEENCDAIFSVLDDFRNRDNSRYTRGIVHGYLLALLTQGIIDNDDAIDILDQLDREVD